MKKKQVLAVSSALMIGTIIRLRLPLLSRYRKTQEVAGSC